jgi:hypothetical protein
MVLGNHTKTATFTTCRLTAAPSAVRLSNTWGASSFITAQRPEIDSLRLPTGDRPHAFALRLRKGINALPCFRCVSLALVLAHASSFTDHHHFYIGLSGKTGWSLALK